MPIAIDRIDHVVINCRDVETTVAWYQRVLGMRRREFSYNDDTHVALHFGRQKFNVRPTGKADWWSVENDAPGTLDLCFVATTPIGEVVAHLAACGVEIANGPVAQTGAEGAMTSVYVYDPDRNLVEIAVYG